MQLVHLKIVASLLYGLKCGLLEKKIDKLEEDGVKLKLFRLKSRD